MGAGRGGRWTARRCKGGGTDGREGGKRSQRGDVGSGWRNGGCARRGERGGGDRSGEGNRRLREQTVIPNIVPPK